MTRKPSILGAGIWSKGVGLVFCVAVSGVMVGAPSHALSAADEFEALDEVPASQKLGTDAHGSLWNLARSGHVENSGNRLVNQAQVMRLDGEEFSPSKASKAREGTRWLLWQKMKEFEVSRDVYYDSARGGVRYVDTIRNSKDVEMQAKIEYHTSFRHPWFQIYTAEGREFEGKLATRDTGIFVKMPEAVGHQGLLYLLAGERSSHKPGIEMEGNNNLRINFTLTIPPKGEKSVVHWVAQRQATDAAAIKELRAEFYRQRMLTGAMIAQEARAGVVNFDLGAAGASEVEPYNEGLLVALNELKEGIGVIRTGQDMLWVAKESQLSGTLEGGAIRCASRFGETEVKIAEVAAIQGGGGRGRRHKVYFRDGTVLQADLVADDLRLKGADGWELELDVAQIEYLFGRIAVADGKVDEKFNLFMRLHSGDVCGVVATGETLLEFMAPWGRFDVPLPEIESMSYLKAPSPRYRLRLRDGSRITAFLMDMPLELRALRFGKVELSVSEIAELWTAVGEVPDLVNEVEDIDDIEEMEETVCLLKGENLIAGRLVNEELHVVSGTTVTTLKPSEIVAITHTYEEESELLPVFEIELKGGDILVGTLREDTLRIESEHLSWKVPVPHFEGLHVADEGG